MNKIEVFHKHPWKTYPVSSFNGLKQTHINSLYFVVDLEGTNKKKPFIGRNIWKHSKLHTTRKYLKSKTNL